MGGNMEAYYDSQEFTKAQRHYEARRALLQSEIASLTEGIDRVRQRIGDEEITLQALETAIMALRRELAETKAPEPKAYGL